MRYVGQGSNVGGKRLIAARDHEECLSRGELEKIAGREENGAPIRARDCSGVGRELPGKS